MPDTATEIAFGDGTYRVWLPLPRVIELERKCGFTDRDGRNWPKSIFTIYEEIGAGLGRDPATEEVMWIGGGSAIARDVNEVIRLGLIGGNEGPDHGDGTEVGPQRAARLVELYGYPARPLSEVCAHAWKILHAAIVGISVKKKDEPPAKVSRKASRKASSSRTAANSG